MKELPIEQLITGRQKAFQNAYDLIQDAEILYEHQRWARCVFLSSIAIEEIGKYIIIIGAIGRVIKSKVNWKTFWKRFKNHTEKSGNIFAFDVLLGPFISHHATISKLVKSLNDTHEAENEKLSSLYMDIKSGEFILPMEAIDRIIAQKALESAKAVLKFFESGERLAFSKMTGSNISVEKFLEAESHFKKLAENFNE